MRITERQLAEIWKRQLVERETLVTLEGRELQVVHPGLPNNDSGPDFRGAALVMGGGAVLRGDVEVHVRARDWWGHGHHHDPNYDGVILHVVMWEGTRSSGALLLSGKKVEVLPLRRCLARPIAELQEAVERPPLEAQPCAQAGDRVAKVLDEAGEQRFLLKAEQFKRNLAQEVPDQVLYEGLMGALGYAKNKGPFRELSRRLPLFSVERLARRFAAEERLLSVQAPLLGVAGMLPSQRGLPVKEAWEESLEHAWNRLGITQAMPADQWRHFRVRSGNSPVRRLAGASYLLSRYLGRHLAEGMVEKVCEAVQDGRIAELELGLMVQAQGYWHNHLDFGLPVGKSPALIGRGRARDITVNVLLPFYFAWSGLRGQKLAAANALNLYRRYPRLEDNWITKHVEAQVLGRRCPDVVSSACRQQGLIHLHRHFCVPLRCEECLLRS